MTQHIQKRRREGWMFLGGTLGLVFSLSYGFMIFKPNNDAFENSFWVTRTKFQSDEAKNMADLHKNFDVLTSAGWRGNIAHENKNNELVMKLIDYVGRPINGIFVAAQVHSNIGSQLVYNNMLKQTADGEYRSNKLGLKKGNWNLTVTARNPESSDETDMIFRFEKQITVIK